MAPSRCNYQFKWLCFKKSTVQNLSQIGKILYRGTKAKKFLTFKILASSGSRESQLHPGGKGEPIAPLGLSLWPIGRDWGHLENPLRKSMRKISHGARKISHRWKAMRKISHTARKSLFLVLNVGNPGKQGHCQIFGPLFHPSICQSFKSKSGEKLFFCKPVVF